jgi:hypothetical protein
MSEIFAEQLTALANVVLAVFAIVTAVLAGLAFLKQSREVSDQAEMLDLQRRQLDAQREDSVRQMEVLKLQAVDLRESLEERRREAGERRKEQAAHAFLTEERRHANPGTITGGIAYIKITVTNNSGEPLYDARLRWHLGDGSSYGDPNPENLGTILPGCDVSKSRSFPLEANLEGCGAVLEFRDAAGVKWLRRPDGQLSEVP